MRRHASGSLHRFVCTTTTPKPLVVNSLVSSSSVVVGSRCASSQWGKAPTGNRTGFPGGSGGGHHHHQRQHHRSVATVASGGNASDLFTGGSGNAPATLEERLQRRFGMHAKLVVREQHNNSSSAHVSAASSQHEDHQSPPSTSSTAQQEPESAASTAADALAADAAPPPRLAFKASVTFKQLGFPVEVASVTAATMEEAQERAFAIAMESNVVLITPNLQRGNGSHHGGEALSRLLEVKHVVDELRSMCQTLGRILKFSVKPKLQQQNGAHQRGLSGAASAEAASTTESLRQDGSNTASSSTPPAQPQPRAGADGGHLPPPKQVMYGCRTYVRDDWAVTANLTFLLEAKSFSPNDALIQAFTAIRDLYRAELSSDEYIKHEFHEAERLLKARGKSVSAVVVTSAPQQAATGPHRNVGHAASASVRSVQAGDDEPPTTPTGGSYEQQQQQFSVVATVTEASGNTYSVRSTQSSVVEAYRAVAQLLLNAEAVVYGHNISIVSQASSKPFLLKLRYQCEGMVYHAVEAGLCGSSVVQQRADGSLGAVAMSPALSSVAARAAAMLSVHIEEVAPRSGIIAAPEGAPTGQDGGTQEEEVPAAAIVSTKPFKYVGRGLFDGQEVASSEGYGPYRVELDVYVQLLSALLDRFPEIARYHFAHCFPSVEVLERAAHHHDHFRLYNHKGKWSCYNVLGTIASTLVADDGRYENDITDVDGGVTGSRSEARITVNDGYRSKRLLARRFDRNHRGRAFRQAATDAIQFNFPLQHQIASEHEEYASGLPDKNDVSTGGKRLRALPREKKVAHVNQLFGVIGCFAEEDYGWDALRVRTRAVAGDATRFVAELETHVKGERTRRVVAVSPIAASAKTARRLLVYQVCKQYFPKDLENYLKLGRNDAKPPEAMHEDNALCRVYSAGTPFFAQVLAMLDRGQPDLAPFTWRVERMRRGLRQAPKQRDPDVLGMSPALEEQQQDGTTSSSEADDDDDGSDESLFVPLHLRFKATVYGNNGDVVVAQRLGNEGEGAFAVVRSVLRATCTTYLNSTSDARELWREFECSPPPAVSSSHDLCHLVFQLSLGGLGGGDGTSRDATSTRQLIAATGQPAMEVLCTLLDESWWVATVTLPNMGHISIARAFARSKREAHRGALIVAARSNFAKQLRFYSKHHVEVQAFADDVFHEAVLTDIPSNGCGPAGHDLVATPHGLLKSCFRATFPTESLVVHHEPQLGGGGFLCRVYRQPTTSSPPSPPKPAVALSAARVVHNQEQAVVGSVEVGYGRGITKRQALQAASLAALELLFEAQLKHHLSMHPSFLDTVVV